MKLLKIHHCQKEIIACCSVCIRQVNGYSKYFFDLTFLGFRGFLLKIYLPFFCYREYESFETLNILRGIRLVRLSLGFRYSKLGKFCNWSSLSLDPVGKQEIVKTRN